MRSPPSTRSSTSRRRHERGSSLVDAALASPVFILLLLGVFEFGLAFRDYLTLTSATRAAARSSSVEGRNSYADYDVLQAIKTNTQTLANSGDITHIVIFKATGPDATLANMGMISCLTTSSSTCNTYVASVRRSEARQSLRLTLLEPHTAAAGTVVQREGKPALPNQHFLHLHAKADRAWQPRLERLAGRARLDWFRHRAILPVRSCP